MEKSKLKTGGIAKFIEEAKNSQNNPNVLNKIIEAMSEKIDELQSKAAAYDRLMSGGKKTPKEVANFLGKPVALDSGLGVPKWFWYDEVPTFVSDPEWQFCGWTSTKRLNELPEGLIEYHGDSKDSLTLPDGWEEK